MTTLNDEQTKSQYIHPLLGFSPIININTPEAANMVREVKEYKGQEHLCIACTQLPEAEYTEAFGVPGYTKRERKRILVEWIEFLQTNKKAFRALHFNSRVPQELFDAACCQENLEELRLKWGAYSDLSALRRLKKIKFLDIGSGAGVRDISVLGDLETIIILEIENFKRIEDYAILARLNKLEQLIIYPGLYGRIPMKDLEFVREMKSLSSLIISATIKRKYSFKELEELCTATATLQTARINSFEYNVTN